MSTVKVKPIIQGQQADTINMLYKAIACFVFRNGPIEQYHSEGIPIHDPQMKIINKFTANRIGFLLTLCSQKKYDDILLLLNEDAKATQSWDDPIYNEVAEDLEIIKEVYKKTRGSPL